MGKFKLKTPKQIRRENDIILLICFLLEIAVFFFWGWILSALWNWLAPMFWVGAPILSVLEGTGIVLFLVVIKTLIKG